MDKLEKVMKGLECCSQMAGEMCRNCPYANECEEGKGILAGAAHLAADALELLKAQEPILLENQHKPGGHFINANSPWISRCPQCGKKVEGRQTKFCKYCGQAVKWE